MEGSDLPQFILREWLPKLLSACRVMLHLQLHTFTAMPEDMKTVILWRSAKQQTASCLTRPQPWKRSAAFASGPVRSAGGSICHCFVLLFVVCMYIRKWRSILDSLALENTENRPEKDREKGHQLRLQEYSPSTDCRLRSSTISPVLIVHTG